MSTPPVHAVSEVNAVIELIETSADIVRVRMVGTHYTLRAARAERALQAAGSMLRTDVHGQAEQFHADRTGQNRVAIALPPIAKINCDGVVAGERLDIELGIFALTDTEISFATGIGGVAGIATFGGEQNRDGAGERRRI